MPINRMVGGGDLERMGIHACNHMFRYPKMKKELQLEIKGHGSSGGSRSGGKSKLGKFC